MRFRLRGAHWAIAALFILLAEARISHGGITTEAGGKRYTLEEEKEVGHCPAPASGNCTVFESSHGGYVFPKEEVADLPPAVPAWALSRNYPTHCVFAQHGTDLVLARIEPKAKNQKIYWMMKLWVEKGSAKGETDVLLWTNGSVHEYEGSVVFGNGSTLWKFDSDAKDHLVLRVTNERRYVHEAGSGTVTLPNGDRIALGPDTKGRVVAKGSGEGKPTDSGPTKWENLEKSN